MCHSVGIGVGHNENTLPVLDRNWNETKSSKRSKRKLELKRELPDLNGTKWEC